MDIGKQQRIIQVEPEPLRTPVVLPPAPMPTPPAQLPAETPQPATVPAGA